LQTEFLINWLANTPAFAVPFALAALGLIITERAGILSLGAEGFMLVGALAGVGSTIIFGAHPFVSFVTGAMSAAVVSLLFAFLVIGLRVNQAIAGLSIVFFCQGLTSLIATQQGWTNRMIEGLKPIALSPFSEIPGVGRILFTQDILVYFTIPIFLTISFVLGHSLIGLRIRAVGENPEAADAAGISVSWHRLAAVVAGASLVGLAGGYLAVGVAKIWVDGMSGGRGWIAIALVIFARWRPWRALAGAVLFGCIEALIPRVAAIGLQLPQYFVFMTPYLATLAVMIWTSLARNVIGTQPAGLGVPFVREERR
jgi:simple sugar transport system permease protein